MQNIETYPQTNVECSRGAFGIKHPPNTLIGVLKFTVYLQSFYCSFIAYTRDSSEVGPS